MRLRSVALHEKAAPPALLHGRRLQREPCKAGWCVGQGREGDRKKREQKKPDLKTKLPTQKHFTNQSSNASKSIHWSTFRPPTRPDSKKLAARRRWHEGCLRTGAMTARTSAKVRISSQRDREAAGGSAQDDVIFNEPGRRSRCRAGRRREPICRGFTRQRDTAMGGITDNISCAAAGKAKPTPSLATK